MHDINYLALFGKTSIDRVKTAIAHSKAGRFIILVDDEDRENEGDLVIPASKITPEHINFMATHARGLICLSLDKYYVNKLDLSLLSPISNQEHLADEPLQTAFTMSIDVKHGTTTGISAHDRAKTIQWAIDDQAKADDFVKPGHMFPLQACDHGVLQRTGQTEGSVDLAHLSKLKKASVICEIMNEDGSMARLPELCKFAKKHNLHILSIADIIDYRLANEKIIAQKDIKPIKDTHLIYQYPSTINNYSYLAVKSLDTDLASLETVKVNLKIPTNNHLLDNIDQITAAQKNTLDIYIFQKSLHCGNENLRTSQHCLAQGIMEQILVDLAVNKIYLTTPSSIKTIDNLKNIEIIDHIKV